MLEGLEITETKHSIVVENTLARLEAEYYLQNSLIKLVTKKGANITSFVQYGTSEELNENQDGYPILRLNEFDSYFIGKPAKYCNKLSYEKFEAYKLLKGDVLICRTNGNPDLVGRAAVVQADTSYGYASYLFKIRPDLNIINSETLVAFLRCSFGREQINKYSMIGNQTNFSPAKFREIDVPILNTQIQNSIKELFKIAISNLNDSQLLYNKSEQILLQELGLNNWKPTNQNNNTKTFKESFEKTGRFDAEYYQPKYDEIEGRIRNYSFGFEFLLGMIEVDSTLTTPDDDKQYMYIELSDIGNNGTVDSVESILGKELPSRARRRVKANDVIISSIEGSLSKCAIIPKDLDGALCSTGFYVLRPKSNMSPEAILVLMKSKAYQDLLKGKCSGTILTAFAQHELEKLPIPKMKDSMISELSTRVQESFRLRKQSKELLERAKHAVEIAIEQNEDEALKYLNNSH